MQMCNKKLKLDSPVGINILHSKFVEGFSNKNNCKYKSDINWGQLSKYDINVRDIRASVV